jgi:DNA-binding winged helix-turn-helix (wHTH) protein
MNVERRIGRHRVGGWDFIPATGELVRRADVRRLEPRAAKALEMLCEAGGDVVTHEQLIRGVWNGRSLSENSVAVVIGQLRRALEDDAREPRLIETIPKRGYRLRTAKEETESRSARRTFAIAVIVAIVLLLGVAVAYALSGRTGTPIAVADVVNETGDPGYDPLARATSELIVTELGERGFAVRRGQDGDLRLASKLVMWDGLPYLGMTATDRAGVVRWSAMIKATPGAVPPGVSAKLDVFAGEFGRRREASLAKAPAPR